MLALGGLDKPLIHDAHISAGRRKVSEHASMLPRRYLEGDSKEPSSEGGRFTL